MTRKSMTAYGRASVQTKRARWILEISSVNRKGLDIHLHLPHPLLFLDPIMRKWIGKIVERGNVTIRLFCDFKEEAQLIQRLKKEKTKWEKIAIELKSPLEEITLSFLLGQMVPQEIMTDEASFEKELAQVWKKATSAWLLMKEQEGKLLIKDIQHRMRMIQRELKVIEKEIPQISKERIAKLSKRMEELKLTIDREQLQKEIALQAEKDDITEEMIRLKSHMKQMTIYLESKETSVGRTLDFLAQEMGREIGTLMAKAGSSEITRRAVHIKSEIEKIREQVQNIE